MFEERSPWSITWPKAELRRLPRPLLAGGLGERVAQPPGRGSDARTPQARPGGTRNCERRKNVVGQGLEPNGWTGTNGADSPYRRITHPSVCGKCLVLSTVCGGELERGLPSAITAKAGIQSGQQATPQASAPYFRRLWRGPTGQHKGLLRKSSPPSYGGELERGIPLRHSRAGGNIAALRALFTGRASGAAAERPGRAVKARRLKWRSLRTAMPLLETG